MSSDDSTDTAPATPATLMPGGSKLTAEEAYALDREIDEYLGTCDQLLRSYLDTGHRLARMKETKGYEALGYKKWGNYLDSKERFRRTFLSYLLKLGRAGDPQIFIDNEMPAAAVIQYIKQIDHPEKVQDLIAATWDDVKNLPANQVGKKVKQYLEVHKAEYKKPRKRRELAPPRSEAVPPAAAQPVDAAPPPHQPDDALDAEFAGDPQAPNWEGNFEKLYWSLPEMERKRFITAMRDFLDSRGDVAS